MDANRTTGANESHDESSIDTETPCYPQFTDQIDHDDLYKALSNSRRRHVISAVEGGERDLGALARAIAAVENDIPVHQVDHQQRKRVYIGLYQTHLDQLEEWDIVEWDGQGTVAPGPAYEAALEAMRAVNGTEDGDEEEDGTEAEEPASVLDRAKAYIWGDA